MAQRRQRHYPEINGIIQGCILVSLILIISLSACQSHLIKNDSSFRARSVWQWAGDMRRTGQSEEDLLPPLKLKWIFNADAALDKAIVCAEDYLFFGIKSGVITIVRSETGQKVNTIKAGNKIDATCLVDGNRLLLAQRWEEPSIRSIAFETGKPVWENELGPITGEPLLAGRRLFAGNERGEIFLLNSASGEVLWKTRLGKPVRGSVALSGRTLACVSDGGMVWALSDSSGRVEWKRQLPGSLTATPVLSDTRLYVGTTAGMFYALSLIDGATAWEKKVEGSIYEKAALDDASVFLGTTQGILYCLNIADGTEKWRFNTQSVVGTSSVISNRHVYFGTLDGIIYALEKNTGVEAWQFRTKGRVRTTPLLWKGMLIAASEDRYVYGFVEEN